jgi:outer membrane protein
MKRFRFIAVTLMLTVAFIGSAFAQTTGKVGIINPDAFEDEKVGIKKLVNAMNTVNTEFTVKQKELQTMQDRINALAKDGDTMLKAYQANPNGPIGPVQIQAKQDEFEKLKTDFNRQREDYNNAAGKRLDQLTGPIYQEISKALDEYAKTKGYSILLDARNLGRSQENPGVSIYLFVDDKADVTIDFVAFCNAKFAAGTTPTTPTKPATTKPQ